MRRPDEQHLPAVADDPEVMRLLPKDTQDWVRENDYPQRRCANRRKVWSCYRCHAATPVGFSFCPMDWMSKCGDRVMAQRDDALAALRELGYDSPQHVFLTAPEPEPEPEYVQWW